MTIKKTFVWSGCIFLSWLIIEFIIDKFLKIKLKGNILKFISEYKLEKYKKYYRIKFKNIRNQLKSIKDEEKDHTLKSLNKTFRNDSLNLKLLIKELKIFRSIRNNKNTVSKYLVCIDKMLWYPYIFRFFVSGLNMTSLVCWKYNYNLSYYKFKKHSIYHILPKNNCFSKTILIFIGLGGLLKPFEKIIDLLLNNNYQIFIPIYGPSQASLDFNLDIHEGEFNNDIYNYLLEFNLNEIDILSWSLGGILYKGFESLVNQNNNKIKINQVFLFEPLISIRGCMDMYLSQLRNFDNTFEIINSVSLEKYFIYNKIFSYFMHTIIGFSTANSFGCFTSVELSIDNKNYTYPRYLFLSSDDIVMNNILDYNLIKNNFDSGNIYYRKGYHGGWLNSNQLEVKFLPLIK